MVSIKRFCSATFFHWTKEVMDTDFNSRWHFPYWCEPPAVFSMFWKKFNQNMIFMSTTVSWLRKSVMLSSFLLLRTGLNSFVMERDRTTTVTDEKWFVAHTLIAHKITS